MIRLLVCLIIAIASLPACAAYETGGVTKSILSNGLTLLVRPEPEARTVAVEVFIRVGASDEPDSKQGVGQLLAGSILAGTKTRSPARLYRLISEVGGNFHAVWQWNYLEVFAVTSPDMCEDTISLLADAIQNSRLDASAVEYARAAILRQARQLESDSFNSAYTALRRMVHRGTPYDRPYLGDPAKITSITRDDLESFYQKNVSADRIVISVAGNVDVQRVTRKVEVCFGNMKRTSATDSSRVGGVSPTGETEIGQNAPVTYIMVGYKAPGVESPDYPAMCVANVLLGGNKSSLLFKRLREERGLGYQVGSVYPALRGESHIAAFVGMDASRATPEILADVKEAIIEQVKVLQSGEFTDDDLEHAKGFLSGSHILKHERTRDRAFYLGWHEVMGLGYQYDFTYGRAIGRVTRDDVRRVCERYMTTPAVVILEGRTPPPNP